MQTCFLRGIAFLVEMDRTVNASTEHYSLAAVGLDCPHNFHRQQVAVHQRFDKPRIQMATQKETHHQSLYTTVIMIYRFKAGYLSLPPRMTTDLSTSMACYNEYMNWLIRSRTFPLEQQSIAETTFPLDFRIDNCPLCSQSLTVCHQKVPLLTTCPLPKRTLLLNKSRCSSCKITFNKLDARTGFLEINGNAYSVALLKTLHYGTIKADQFSSTFHTVVPDSHVPTQDALIALRVWQDLTLFPPLVCSECGDNPPMLLADVSGKRMSILCSIKTISHKT